MIKRELGIDAELVKGRGGIFDVAADGDVIYSKHTAGRFPDDDEVIAAIRSRM